jgi:tetratricopeptide (TPR) repeat protein
VNRRLPFHRPGGCAVRHLVAAVVVFSVPYRTARPAQSTETTPAADTDTRSVTETISEAVAEALDAGRGADAEDLARAELAKQASAAAELQLALVLMARADELASTSELGRSLRLAVLEEAGRRFRAAGREPALRADAVIGLAASQIELEMEAEAEATLREGLSTPLELERPVRRRLVGELVRFLALRKRSAEAESFLSAGAEAGFISPADLMLERLHSVALERDAARALPAAVAAATAGADGFEIAFQLWDAQSELPFERQLAAFSQLLLQFPDVLAFRYYRGATRLRMGDAAGALEDLRPCVDAPPFGELARGLTGRALLQERQAEAALPWFTPLLGKRGQPGRDAIDGVIGVAVARAMARDFAGALELYRRVLELDPTNPWAHLGVPLCHKSLGNVAAAAAAYEAGLEALPEDPQLLNDYGLLLRGRGDKAAARAYFERAISAGSADGGENLGIFALRDDDDAAAAAAWFARTLELDPERPRVRFYRELCLSRILGAREQ